MISGIILVAVFNDFVNIIFQLFVIQTTEIHVFTRVHKEHCIVCFHGMLIRRPLAAQLSYLLIYWSSALLGLPGQAGGAAGLRVPGPPGTRPGGTFGGFRSPSSSFQCPFSHFHSNIWCPFFGFQSQSLKG